MLRIMVALVISQVVAMGGQAQHQQHHHQHQEAGTGVKVGIENNVVVREEKSQKQYVRGVSGWNFTMDDFDSTGDSIANTNAEQFNGSSSSLSSPRTKKGEGKQQVGRFEVWDKIGPEMSNEELNSGSVPIDRSHSHANGTEKKRKVRKI